MKRMLFVLLVVFPLFVLAADYSKVAGDKSSITFVFRQMGVAVEGGFKRFTANVRINPSKAESGTAHIAIDVASIDAGSEEANDEVKGKSWFGVGEFPQASFVSTAVKALGSNQFEASGKLTIKGKTLLVRAPFTIKQEKDQLTIDGVLPIKRLEYGIGSGAWSDTSIVADEVQIKFHLVLK